MVAFMQPTTSDAVLRTAPILTKPALVLNRPKLDELRKANGIATESDLASIIGIAPETLWRATNGNPVSGLFVARIKVAFPHVLLDSLFEVVHLDSLVRAS